MNISLDRINQGLLNDFQHYFPITSEPFKVLAEKMCTDEEMIINRTKKLQKEGSISRIGPVFKPNTVGVSCLAAISVPPVEIEQYANIINTFPQVNHNYEREHEINLWFVLTAPNQTTLNKTIFLIEQKTQKVVLVLPMLQEYHIDLGFRMRHLKQNKHFDGQAILKQLASERPLRLNEVNAVQQLVAATQAGLPLVKKPFLALAKNLDWQESEVIDGLKTMIKEGAIKRFGVVVRHHEMGYRANAMVVWDVPDSEIDTLGKKLGDEKCVTLCYRRPRVLPRWPYNLFCMLHGQNRDDVLACIDEIQIKHRLQNWPQQVLFSGRRFKQRGALYHQPKVPTQQRGG